MQPNIPKCNKKKLTWKRTNDFVKEVRLAAAQTTRASESSPNALAEYKGWLRLYFLPLATNSQPGIFRFGFGGGSVAEWSIASAL